MAELIMQEEVSNPSTPATGKWKVFFKSDGIYIIDDAGVVTGPFGTGGAGLPAGHLFGLTLSNNGTDPTNDIDIAAGKCRSDDDTTDMVLASALTKQLDASWAVGTNAGGRASGAAIANTTYHVFLIKRPDTGVVDVAFDTSATGANIAANTDAAYTKKRRIGSIVRSGSVIRAFKQDGDTFIWSVPSGDVSVTNPGTSAVLRTMTLPVGIRVQAIISAFGYANTAAANTSSIFISDPSITDSVPSNSVFNLTSYNGGSVENQNGSTVYVFTNTSAQVRSRVQQSAAGTVLVMNTLGWIDTRGRLS